ncbi:hypothetical protein DFH28DRAFT_891498 [Melampsora americana]|nr:hypothetical protein DFH28DRAFT_891498 [Melampsora americana]
MNEEEVKPILESNENEDQDEVNQLNLKLEVEVESISNSKEEKENDEESLANLTCSICLGSPSPLVVTQCGHVACGGCLAASLASQTGPMLGYEPQPSTQNNGKCPVCRTMLVGGWGTSMRGAILKMGDGST